MIRGVLYLLASGVLWAAEGYVFSRFLRFSLPQTIMLAVVYAALFAGASRWFAQLLTTSTDADLPAWRYVSLAPMVTLILGSFVSLPIVLLIAALGRLA
jgi:hypothetical protein